MSRGRKIKMMRPQAMPTPGGAAGAATAPPDAGPAPAPGPSGAGSAMRGGPPAPSATPRPPDFPPIKPGDPAPYVSNQALSKLLELGIGLGTYRMGPPNALTPQQKAQIAQGWSTLMHASKGAANLQQQGPPTGGAPQPGGPQGPQQGAPPPPPGAGPPQPTQ